MRPPQNRRASLSLVESVGKEPSIGTGSGENVGELVSDAVAMGER